MLDNNTFTFCARVHRSSWAATSSTVTRQCSTLQLVRLYRGHRECSRGRIPFGGYGLSARACFGTVVVVVRYHTVYVLQ